MEIRIRAIVVIIATNFMIILLSILAGTGYLREHIENYIEADMMVVADIADRFISLELNMLRHEAGMTAGSLAAAGPDEWDGILVRAARQYHGFTGFTVMSRSGAVAASAGAGAASSELIENEYIQKAFIGQTAFTSTVSSGGPSAIYLAAPIGDAVEHILILTLDGLFFSNLVSQYKVWETGHIFIDDKDGYVLANPRSEWVLSRQNFILQTAGDPQYENVTAIIRKLTAGERGIGYYSLGGITRICAYRPISGSTEGWALGIVAPLSESPVRDINWGLIIIAVVSFLLNVAAAVVGSNFIKKPFEEVAALRAAAEADSRAKSTFLAHMSHEIRTPLNTIVGLSELALNYGCQDDETEDRLGKIQASGLTILSIVNDILDISKIESGKFELFNAEYETPSLINDIVTLNIVSIGEKPLTFKLDVDENLPGALYGDDLRVKQIFNNLLSNAFKYTQAGEVEWRVSHQRDGEDVWLISSIRDTGIGIKPEDLRKLFSDYNQVDMEANRKVEGTGLGLAITKRLVNMMGGSIEVTSEYGRGTVFRVRLRQGFVSEASIGRKVAENLMGLRYMLSKRANSRKLARVDLSYAQVLVVDDIVTNLEVVKGMMKPYGVKVDCAMSGLQAIELIRAGEPRYGAVFMDHMMPVMDGLEATRIIREEIGTEYAENVPIIALTANAIVGNEEMFLNNGFQGFISKPIDTTKLDAIMRRWLRDKNLEREVLKNEAARPPESALGGWSGEGFLRGITIEGLDLDGALKRFSGDETVVIGVLRSYATGTRALLGDLRGYLAEENLDEFAIAVHGIKGSSYGLCAREVGLMAEGLEKAARAGNQEAVRDGYGGFEKTAEKLLAAIEGALAAVDAAADKPVAQTPDPELLLELREAARAFDMDRVDASMASLEAFRYERGGELVAWLREQVGGMAFEEIFNLSLDELQARADQATDSRPTEGRLSGRPDFTAPEAEILIVDDNATNLKAAQGLLKPLKMRLDTAQSGEEALRMVQEKPYHLIFMDHLMPMMDGLEAAARLRRLEGGRNVPVIALTADETPDLKARFLAAGVNDFAAKPIDMEEICAKIRRWLPGELLHEQAPPEAPESRADLPVIDGIDSQAGIRYSNTKELFIRLLGDFYRLIGLKSAKIETCLAEGLCRDLAVETHALKNTARMIGAGELAEAFGRLERYGREDDLEALERETPLVLEQFRAFKARLAPFGETAEEDRRAASGAELISRLRWLRSAMEVFDLDGADEALGQLEELRLPEECRADMENLRAYVADAAAAEVWELAEKMIKAIEGLAEDQG